MNILILEDEPLVIQKRKKSIKKKYERKNELIITLNYLTLKDNNKLNSGGYIKISDKIKLLGFDYILLDRDNECGIDFHSIFFEVFDKNIKYGFIKKFNDINKLANSIYLISGSYKNNLHFIDVFIDKLIKYKLINNYNQQEEIENILNKNTYTKSIEYKFKELLNLIKK